MKGVDHEVSKYPYIRKLATNIMLDIQKPVVAKDELINYYIHTLNDQTLMRYDLSVNDVVEAAKMCGKKVKGKSILEINVSFKEQMEFYSSNDCRLYSGNSRCYRATRVLEENKELVISSYLNDIKIKIIAENFKCSEVVIRRFLIKKGIIEKKIRKSRKKVVI